MNITDEPLHFFIRGVKYPATKLKIDLASCIKQNGAHGQSRTCGAHGQSRTCGAHGQSRTCGAPSSLPEPEKLQFTVYYINHVYEMDGYWSILTNLIKKQKAKGQCPVVAFDTERDIITSKRYPYQLARVRVMSICTEDVCFVILFSGITGKLEGEPGSRYILPKEIAELLDDNGVIKTCVSYYDEKIHLQSTFVKDNTGGNANTGTGSVIVGGLIGEKIRIMNPVDLQTLYKLKNNTNETPSLKAMVSQYLGIEMSKDERLSMWNVDELTRDQIIYSALDSIYTYILTKYYII